MMLTRIDQLEDWNRSRHQSGGRHWVPCRRDHWVGQQYASFSSPSVTTKSWTNFCTAWPSPRAAFCPISSSSSQEVQRKGLDADSSPYNPRNGALLGQSWELQLQTVTQHGEGGEVSCGGEVQLHRSHGEEVGDKQQPVGGPCVETKSNRSWRWEIVLQCPGIAH